MDLEQTRAQSPDLMWTAAKITVVSLVVWPWILLAMAMAACVASPFYVVAFVVETAGVTWSQRKDFSKD